MKKSVLHCLIPASIVALTGCGMFSDSNKPTAENKIITPSISVVQCSNVNDPTVDAELAVANDLAQASLSQMSTAANDGSWSDVKNSAPTAALATYNQILAKYPNHCGAQFGKAIAMLANLTTNQDISNGVDRLNTSANGDTLSYTAFLNMKTEKVPSQLFRVSMATAKSNTETIAQAQEALANSALPVADTAIALLSSVLAYNNFAFEFHTDQGTAFEDTIIINKGQVGPTLAALKMIKALIVAFVSVQSEVALNGKYDWIDTLNTIQNSDFDQLRPTQSASLDQLISFTDKNSPFLTVKSAWQSSYAAIPSLIKSAIVDVQTSLAYSISLADSNITLQKHAPYTVGRGTTADVSPDELQGISDNLGRLNKYLEGPVSIEYNTRTLTSGLRKSDTLVVDFPKFFQVFNGYLDLLPYHKVLPYAQWNDTIAGDTSWTTSHYIYSSQYGLGKALGDQISASIYNNQATVLNYSDYYGYQYDATYGYSLSSYIYYAQMSNGDSVVYKISNCSAILNKASSTVYDTISLSGCKVYADYVGNTPTAHYIYDISATLRGPYAFTDASGNLSFGTNQAKDIHDVYNLQGLAGFNNKIVFPDPTFGGVFPKLTNNTVWTTLGSLKNIKPRSACSETDSYGYCTKNVLPQNPSDLDVLNYYFE